MTSEDLSQELTCGDAGREEAAAVAIAQAIATTGGCGGSAGQALAQAFAQASAAGNGAAVAQALAQADATAAQECLPATPTGQHPLVPNKPTEPENNATANSGEEEPTAPNKPTEPTVASEPEPEPITMIEEPTEPTEPIEPTQPEPEPITVMEPAVDDTASINGGEDQPKAPASVSEVVPSNSNQPPADHQKLQEDLACGCQRTKPAAVAAAQALANAGGNCNSPVGQALAQAYAQAVAPGKGQAVAQAFASADASSAQKCLNPATANHASLSTCVAAFVGDCCTNQGLAAGTSCGLGGVRQVISTSPRVIETAGIASTRCSC